MAGKYDAVVKAALSETQSKFAMAEELARAIPRRQRGTAAKNRGEPGLKDLIQEVADAIVCAGGESYSPLTLERYRAAALWALDPQFVNGRPRFRWVQGASFRAHFTAAHRGISHDELAALPVKTAEEVEKLARQKHGQPKEQEYEITCSECGEVTGCTTNRRAAHDVSKDMACAECLTDTEDDEQADTGTTGSSNGYAGSGSSADSDGQDKKQEDKKADQSRRKGKREWKGDTSGDRKQTQAEKDEEFDKQALQYLMYARADWRHAARCIKGISSKKKQSDLIGAAFGAARAMYDSIKAISDESEDSGKPNLRVVKDKTG